MLVGGRKECAISLIALTGPLFIISLCCLIYVIFSWRKQVGDARLLAVAAFIALGQVLLVAWDMMLQIVLWNMSQTSWIYKFIIMSQILWHVAVDATGISLLAYTNVLVHDVSGGRFVVAPCAAKYNPTKTKNYFIYSSLIWSIPFVIEIIMKILLGFQIIKNEFSVFDAALEVVQFAILAVQSIVSIVALVKFKQMSTSFVILKGNQRKFVAFVVVLIMCQLFQLVPASPLNVVLNFNHLAILYEDFKKVAELEWLIIGGEYVIVLLQYVTVIAVVLMTRFYEKFYEDMSEYVHTLNDE